jgi:hypothetical protein
MRKKEGCKKERKKKMVELHLSRLDAQTCCQRWGNLIHHC